jgi:hypothetical protein
MSGRKTWECRVSRSIQAGKCRVSRRIDVESVGYLAGLCRVSRSTIEQEMPMTEGEPLKKRPSYRRSTRRMIILEEVKRIRADARILKFLISGFACLKVQNYIPAKERTGWDLSCSMTCLKMQKHIPAKARSAFTLRRNEAPANPRLVGAARARRAQGMHSCEAKFPTACGPLLISRVTKMEREHETGETEDQATTQSVRRARGEDTATNIRLPTLSPHPAQAGHQRTSRPACRGAQPASATD